MKTIKYKITVHLMLLGSLGGTLLQLGCPGKIARNINPCGTVMNCDPLEWDLMFIEYPDWDRDPTCTIPGLCGGAFPLGTGGGTATGTTATTTTTTTTGTTTGQTNLGGGFAF